MEENLAQQSFLDTSVLRSILLGTETYRSYFRQALADQSPHISNYVQMEMRRSFLVNIIAFYFILSLETIPTLNDAISFWNNEFRASKLKAFIQFLPELTTLVHANNLDSNNPEDKEKVLYPGQTHLQGESTAALAFRVFMREDQPNPMNHKR